MLKIKEAIVVEGRYDKNTLSQVVDALIIPVDGFQVFKKRDTVKLLRRVAEKRGLIILTDSDGAGFVIRNYLKGSIPTQWVKQAYIPDVYGKEKRKAAPGKEGKLGVEGMSPQVLEAVLRRAGATVLGEAAADVARREITKADLFQDGLSGGSGSKERRSALLKAMELPGHLSPNALVQVLNGLVTYEEYREIIQELQ